MYKNIIIILCITLLLYITISGCSNDNPQENIIDGDMSISHKNILNKLSEPYIFVKMLEYNIILAKNSKTEEKKIIMRGIQSTGIIGYDAQTKFSLNNWLSRSDSPIYLINDTIVKKSDTEIIAVVLVPTVRSGTVEINTGDIELKAEKYVIIPMRQLIYGECLLDRSDKDYWLYEAFERAEAKAKKKKEGYWKTHAE